MTNLNRVAVTAAFAMFFSGLAFSQAVFSVEKVTTASPNSMMPINNSGSIVVNTGNSALYDVTTWDRVNGTKSLGLTGLANVGADIANSGSVVGAGDPDNSGVLQAFFWQPAGGIEWLGSPLGAHNREVLGDLLGLSEERIAELSKKGVI